MVSLLINLSLCLSVIPPDIITSVEKARFSWWSVCLSLYLRVCKTSQKVLSGFWLSVYFSRKNAYVLETDRLAFGENRGFFLSLSLKEVTNGFRLNFMEIFRSKDPILITIHIRGPRTSGSKPMMQTRLN